MSTTRINVANNDMKTIVRWLPPLLQELKDKLYSDDTRHAAQTTVSLGVIAVPSGSVQEALNIKSLESIPTEFDAEAMQASFEDYTTTFDQVEMMFAAIYDKAVHEFLAKGQNEPVHFSRLDEILESKVDIEVVKRITLYEALKRMREWLIHIQQSGELDERKLEEFRAIFGITANSEDEFLLRKMSVEAVENAGKSGEAKRISFILDNLLNEAKLKDAFNATLGLVASKYQIV